MDVNNVLDFIDHHGLKEPTRIAIKQNGKFTEVKEYEFSRTKRHQDAPEQAIERS
jgi:hypothetical protein